MFSFVRFSPPISNISAGKFGRRLAPRVLDVPARMARAYFGVFSARFVPRPIAFSPPPGRRVQAAIFGAAIARSSCLGKICRQISALYCLAVCKLTKHIVTKLLSR